MRHVNRRFVVAGAVLVVAALGFFVYILGLAPRSNDPQALTETVGRVSGAAGAIGLVLIVLGFAEGSRPDDAIAPAPRRGDAFGAS